MNKQQELVLKDIMPLIQKNARRFAGSNDTLYEDLVSEGYMAAIESVDTHNSDLSSLKSYMINNSRYAQLNHLRGITTSRNRFTDGIETEELEEAEKIEPVSFDDINEVYDPKLLKYVLLNCLLASEKSTRVLFDYYGIGSSEPCTLAEISQKYKISIERIKQILDGIKDKLKKLMKRERIKLKFGVSKFNPLD